MREQGGVESIRVLLVDDEEGFRAPLAKRLSRRGMQIKDASNGREALSILSQDPVDVIVMDVKMPVMNGLEALKQIKETRPGMEVILLTGHASAQDGVDGIKLGAFDYLPKPVEFEHLYSKIRQAREKIVRDREKKAEAEFRAQMEQQMIVTERLASLGTLAAGIAHEINNPLSIIRESAGWMKSLLQKEELANIPRREDLELALGKIEASVERAKKITHQLLGFVRRGDGILREVNLGNLVDEVIQLVDREASYKGLEFIREFRTDDLTVWSDPNQLRQVLFNLVNNAVQASAKGGKVRIRVEGDADKAVLRVTDHGHGIPREHLEKIFEPFFTTKPPGQGTGLGLSISRSIMVKLGGTIEVESQLGRGASFWVTLPRRKRFAGSMETEADFEPAPDSNERRTGHGQDSR